MRLAWIVILNDGVPTQGIHIAQYEEHYVEATTGCGAVLGKKGVDWVFAGTRYGSHYCHDCLQMKLSEMMDMWGNRV